MRHTSTLLLSFYPLPFPSNLTQPTNQPPLTHPILTRNLSPNIIANRAILFYRSHRRHPIAPVSERATMHHPYLYPNQHTGKVRKLPTPYPFSSLSPSPLFSPPSPPPPHTKTPKD